MTRASAGTYDDPHDLAFRFWAGVADDVVDGELDEGKYIISGTSDELVIYDANHPDGLDTRTWLEGFSMHALPGVTVSEVNELIEEVDNVAWHAELARMSPAVFARDALSNALGDQHG